ncbi:hypothetical protein [Ruminiclostridium hungatei]|nr:hypothetical protein [Ruminiclostridium hungatei]
MALSMAACGDKDSAATGSPATDSTAERTEAAGRSTVQATTSAEPVKLEDAEGTVVMWNWGNQDQLKETLANFNTRYPKVKVESVPVASADYVKKDQDCRSSKNCSARRNQG